MPIIGSISVDADQQPAIQRWFDAIVRAGTVFSENLVGRAPRQGSLTLWPSGDLFAVGTNLSTGVSGLLG